jgi:phosphoribosylformimino-5-aminoimidazole carboxamide ribotide isomerase
MIEMPFRVIPVLDIKAGQAVHAVAGRRHDYQPLVSRFHPHPQVVPLARALRDRLGRRPLYLADLDAITTNEPQTAIHQALQSIDVELWIDAGLTTAASAAQLLPIDESDHSLIAGLETIQGPAELAAIIRLVGPNRVILSLDLFGGQPRLAAPDLWTEPGSPDALARQAIDLGIDRMILLDIARVGTGQGTGTQALASAILSAHPEIELIVGGGISSVAELAEWKALGVSGVLVGSALHDGRITVRDLAELEGRRS